MSDPASGGVAVGVLEPQERDLSQDIAEVKNETSTSVDSLVNISEATMRTVVALERMQAVSDWCRETIRSLKRTMPDDEQAGLYEALALRIADHAIAIREGRS